MAELNAQVVITAKDLASGTLEKFGNKLNDTQKIAGFVDKALLGLAGGFTALAAVGFKAAQAFGQQEDAMARLGAGLRNVGEDINDHGIALLNQASALQRSTRFADEQIISAQAMLTTFKLNTGQIQQITPRILDMAEALRKSSGGTIDLEQASILLGKAIGGEDVEGLAGALRRVGVVMTEVQTEMLKTGTMEERLTVLTQIMDQNFAGFAEAGGKTFNGQMQIMRNQIGEVMETIGAFVVNALAPLVSKISEVVTKFNEFQLSMSIPDAIKATLAETLGADSPLYKFLVFVLDHGQEISSAMLGIAAGLIAMKVALIGFAVISAVVTAFQIFAALITAFQVGGFLASLGLIVTALGGPFTIAIVAIGLLVAAFTMAWINNWMNIRENTEIAINFVIGIFKLLTDALFLLDESFVAVMDSIISTVINGTILFATFMIEGFFNLSKTVVDIVLGLAASIAGAFGFTGARDAIVGFKNYVFGIFEGIVGALQDFGRRMVENLISGIKGAARGAFESAKVPLPDFLRRQTGGFVSGNKPVLVGEAGPEVFTPTNSGAVTPVSRMGGIGGGVNLNVYVGIYAGNQSEKRALAVEFYQGLVDIAKSQNKSVSELLEAF